METGGMGLRAREDRLLAALLRPYKACLERPWPFDVQCSIKVWWTEKRVKEETDQEQEDTGNWKKNTEQEEEEEEEEKKEEKKKRRRWREEEEKEDNLDKEENTEILSSCKCQPPQSKNTVQGICSEKQLMFKAICIPNKDHHKKCRADRILTYSIQPSFTPGKPGRPGAPLAGAGVQDVCA